MSTFNVMAVKSNHRSENAECMQNLFTKYGCMIKVRLGLHETANCTENGLIILKLEGNKEEIADFQNELNSIEGVKANTMEI